jgi:hypothetical protein
MIRSFVCGRWDFRLFRWWKQGTEPSGQLLIVQVFIEEGLDRGTEIAAAIACCLRLLAHHLALPPQRTLRSAHWESLGNSPPGSSNEPTPRPDQDERASRPR